MRSPKNPLKNNFLEIKYVQCGLFLIFALIQNQLINSQQLIMTSFSQIQNRTSSPHLYFELHNTQRNKTYNTQKNHSDHEYFLNTKMLAKPSFINESVQSEINLQLLKQVKVKNEILSAQLEEYKLLVAKMQKKMGQLRKQNKELQEKLAVVGKSTQCDSKYQKDEKAALMQTMPLHNLLKQQRNEVPSISCSQIKQILMKFQQNISQIGQNKTQVKAFLIKMVEQKHEMQNFINNLWELKDKIEPGNQQYLYQLWKWVKIVAINYSQLKQYKNSKDQRHIKKERS